MSKNNSFESDGAFQGPSLEKSQESLEEQIANEEMRLRNNLDTLKNKLEHVSVFDALIDNARAAHQYTAEFFNLCVALGLFDEAALTYVKAVNEADPSTQTWVKFSLLALGAIGYTAGYFNARRKRLERNAGDIDEGDDLKGDGQNETTEEPPKNEAVVLEK